MASLLVLLGVLLGSLAAYAQVSPAADFDVKQMSGMWYEVGLGSDYPWFVSNKDKFKMAKYPIIVTPEGNLIMSAERLKAADGSCYKYSYTAVKGDKPGVFTYDFQSRHHLMTVVKVKYDEYALIHLKVKVPEGFSVMTKFLARSEEPSTQAKVDFKTLSMKFNIKPQNVIFHAKSAYCPA